jgi:hypothetical protein
MDAALAWLEQAQHQAPEGGFAATGLAYKAQRLPFLQTEIDV